MIRPMRGDHRMGRLRHIDIGLTPGAFTVNGDSVTRRGRGRMTMSTVPARAERRFVCVELMHLSFPPKGGQPSEPLPVLRH